jgi:hypothetical protein
MQMNTISLAGDLSFLGCFHILFFLIIHCRIFTVRQTYYFLHSNVVYDGEFDDVKMYDRSICHQAIFYRKEDF